MRGYFHDRSETHSQTLPTGPNQDQARSKSVAGELKTEAIERVIDEHEKNRLVIEATERCLKSGIEISGVCGVLGS
jgi:hypothetical protein